MDSNYHALLWSEVDDIGGLLHQLDAADWDEPSLCEGWAVRDVIGHMCYGHTTKMPTVMVQLAKYRFDVPKGSFELSKQFAAGRSPEELVAFWDEQLVKKHSRKGIARTIKDPAGFLDHFIHQQDIRRPLGRPRAIPEARLIAALDQVPVIDTSIFSTKKRVDGLRLVATDVAWAYGVGPTVEGPAEAIVLAAGGREVALDELSGEGVGALSERILAT